MEDDSIQEWYYSSNVFDAIIHLVNVANHNEEAKEYFMVMMLLTMKLVAKKCYAISVEGCSKIVAEIATVINVRFCLHTMGFLQNWN